MRAVEGREERLRGREVNGTEASGGWPVGEREYRGKNQKAGAVERTAIGSGDLLRAWRRRGHRRGHGAVMSAVTAAAGRQLRLLGAGEQRRQRPKRKKRDDQDGQGTPHRCFDTK